MTHRTWPASARPIGRSAGDPDLPIILATGVSHLLTHAYLLLYPVLLLLLQREFGIGLLALGLIANAHYFASGAGALPAGWIADRIGPVPALRICMFGSAVSLLLLAFAASPAWLAVALTLLGCFCSLHHPAGLALLSLGTQRSGRALVLHGMIGNVGIALTPFVAAALAGQVGWRAACALFALPGLVAGSIFSTRIGGRKSAGGGAGAAAAADPDAIVRADPESGPPAAAATGPGGSPGPLSVRWKPLLFLYLSVTLSGFVYSGVMTFLPARMAAADGSGAPARAGAVTSAALLVGMLGQYVGGILWKRLSPVLLIAALLGLSSPCLWLTGRDPLWLAAFGAAAFAFFHFAAQPISNGTLPRFVPVRRLSLGYGVHFTLSFGIGSFAAAAAGYVAQRRGLPAVFPFFALFSAAAALAISGARAQRDPGPRS